MTPGSVCTTAKYTERERVVDSLVRYAGQVQTTSSPNRQVQTTSTPNFIHNGLMMIGSVDGSSFGGLLGTHGLTIAMKAPIIL